MSKEAVYVKFSTPHYVSIRKKIWGGAISSINLLKYYKIYKELRKYENKLRKELKTEIKECKDSLDNFIDSIPKVKEEINNHKNKEVKNKTKKKSNNKKKKIKELKQEKTSRLDQELKDIQNRLSSLN